MPIFVADVLLPAAASAGAAAGVFLLTALTGHALLPCRWRRRAVVAVPLGLSAGTLGLGLLLWGAGTLLGTRWMPVVAAPALLLGLWRAPSFLRDLRRLSGRLALLVRASPLPAALLALLLLLATPALVAPVCDSDGLRYHLAFPRLFLQAGRVFDVPWDVTSLYPQTVEMLFLAGLWAGPPESAKFLHFYFFLAGLATIALAAHTGRRTRAAALLAPVFLAASPAAGTLAPAAFVEHVAGFHVAVAFLLLSRSGGWRLAALPAAGALAAKLTAAPAAAALVLAAGLRAPRGSRLKAVLLGGLAVTALYAPFAVRAYARTGDPIFPFGLGLLGRPIPGVSEESRKWSTHYRGEAAPLSLPWLPGGPEPPDDVVGIHLLAGILLAPWALRDRRALAFAAPVAAYAPLLLGFAPTTRYLLPALQGLAALGAVGLSRILPRAAPVAGLVLALPGAVWTGHLLLTGQRPADVLFGRIGRDAYLARQVPGYRVALYLRHLPPGGVMALDFPAPFYLDRPFVAEGALNEPPLKTWLRGGADGAGLLERTRSLGVRWILVTPGYGGGTPLSLLAVTTPEDSRGVTALLDLRSRLRLAATVDGVDVWEVPSAPRPVLP